MSDASPWTGAEVSRLTKMLADCYRETGADPGCASDKMLAEKAVDAVRRRNENQCSEIARQSREIDVLHNRIAVLREGIERRAELADDVTDARMSIGARNYPRETDGALILRLAAEVERLTRERDDEERACLEVIDERDNAQDLLARIYRAAGGDRDDAWVAYIPARDPPDSGNAGVDALWLVQNMKAQADLADSVVQGYESSEENEDDCDAVFAARSLMRHAKALEARVAELEAALRGLLDWCVAYVGTPMCENGCDCESCDPCEPSLPHAMEAALAALAPKEEP